ncbi:MAG: ABC transporter permease [Rhodospirillales bacterium 70-18]|nr:ABC transporter substrate-binding protein [Rhodospirillales bacterium]OJY70176.1 MAG: ABC transporter permease [Rhodospirillales bacterium 70-18]
MRLSRRTLIATAATTAAALPLSRARAQKPVLKLGVLTDMSGPYKDIAGPVALASTELAVAEFKAAHPGMEVEVISADHQNKPDIGVAITRKWFDVEGADVVMEVANSAVSLAVAGVAREKNKIFLACGGATSDLTGSACSPNTIHWVYDTYMLAKSTGGAMVKTGGDSWYFLTADYAFGHALQRDVTGFVQQAGGKVLGASPYPFPGTTDFSSFLLQAQASGAKVLGLANAGTDTISSIKQAKEFGIKMKLAGLLVFISDIHSMGLPISQGLVLTESFYWDMNPRTRAFAERLKPRAPTVRPTMTQAGTYSCASHYLKVAAAMGPAEAKKSGAATIARMKATPTDDDAFGPGSIRADGRKIHPSYLFEVKAPAESKAPWDYYKLLATTPADEAFRPLAQGGCPMVKA